MEKTEKMQRLVNKATKYPWRYGRTWSNNPFQKELGAMSFSEAAEQLDVPFGVISLFYAWWKHALRGDPVSFEKGFLRAHGIKVPAATLVRRRRASKRVHC